MELILRYVPKSCHKEEELPFTGVTNGDTEGKKANVVRMSSLKESAMFLIRKMYQLKVNRHPLTRFISSSIVFLKVDYDLPYTRTKEEFDPNAYKHMGRASYNFQDPTTIVKIVDARNSKKDLRARRISRSL